MSIRTIARWRWVYLAWVIPIIGFIGSGVIFDWEYAAVTEVAERLKANPPKSLQEVQHILEGHPYEVGPERKSTYVVGADERNFMFKPMAKIWVSYTPRQKIVVDYGLVYRWSNKVDLDDIEGTGPGDVNWPSTLIQASAMLALWAGAWEIALWCAGKEKRSIRIIGYVTGGLCLYFLCFSYVYVAGLVLFFETL